MTFCSKVGLPVIGLIENMSGFKCPNCKESLYLFATGGVEALAKEKDIAFLGAPFLFKFCRFRTICYFIILIRRGKNKISLRILGVAI